jgi:hypothetical protein
MNHEVPDVRVEGQGGHVFWAHGISFLLNILCVKVAKGFFDLSSALVLPRLNLEEAAVLVEAERLSKYIMV